MVGSVLLANRFLLLGSRQLRLQGSGGLLEPLAARRRLSQRWAQALHPLPRPLLATRSALLLVVLEGAALLVAVPVFSLLRLLLLLPPHLVLVPSPRNHPACLELLRLLSLALWPADVVRRAAHLRHQLLLLGAVSNRVAHTSTALQRPVL